jgi:hypothetical protein
LKAGSSAGRAAWRAGVDEGVVELQRLAAGAPRCQQAAQRQALAGLPAVEGVVVVLQQHQQRGVVQAVVQQHRRREAAQQRGHRAARRCRRR